MEVIVAAPARLGVPPPRCPPAKTPSWVGWRQRIPRPALLHVPPHSISRVRRGRSSTESTDDVGIVMDWVDATSNFFEEDARPIMLFDGVCNLCNGGVKFARTYDSSRRLRYESLQSESGRNLLRRSGRDPDDISSVVLVEKDRSYIKSDAVLRIMGYLDVPFPQLALLASTVVPPFIRDWAYDNVADNRYNVFGRTESCDIQY